MNTEWPPAVTLHSIKPRVQEIFYELLGKCTATTTEELAERYRLTTRSIRNDLDAIAKLCEDLPVKLIRKRNGVWLNGEPDAKLHIQEQLRNSHALHMVNVSNFRLYRLLSILLTADEPIVVKQVQDLLEASARTVYTDMDRAETWLGELGLQLTRKPHYGAKVEGSELLRRYACFKLLLDACPRVEDLDLCYEPESLCERLIAQMDVVVLESIIDVADVAQIVQLLGEMIQKRPHITTYWTKFALYAAVVLKRIKRGYQVLLTKSNVKQLQETHEYAYAVQFVDQLRNAFRVTLGDEERAAITLYMLGLYPNLELDAAYATPHYDPFTENLVRKMLSAVDTGLGIMLSTDEDLFRGLILHIKPMVCRLLHGMVIQNELLNEIKEDHTLAYYAAVLAGQRLESIIGKPINAAEIGYIALHFGAALERRRERPQVGFGKIRAWVVCGGGIGTGKILQSRIEVSLPNLNVERVLDQEQVQRTSHVDADIIVSTVPLTHVSCPHIVVNPLLPLPDYHRLQRWVQVVVSEPNTVPVAARLKVSIQTLIRQHFDITEPSEVEKEIDRMFARVSSYLTLRQDTLDSETSRVERNRKKVLRMLDVLTEDCIQVQNRAQSPEEVIKTAGALLVQAGAVEPRYVEAMKTSLEVNGPYMVIVPGVAILHAKPEDGVRRVCMSLVTLSEGIRFGHKDNDPVDIAIAFSAVDQTQHLQALSDLMRILTDETALHNIRTADSVALVLETISQIVA
ncbi:BglG family transcription antiterminator [Alicyclobacillus hesperidum]|uniref:BglG family transcription antiterminator n=1 Tax=Alicyclobacillus hesperidum TaxID=89784 RepID=UPI00031A7D54|nr:BglG family transcription antiterminator [Alicyclobacillus hesperidum]